MNKRKRQTETRTATTTKPPRSMQGGALAVRTTKRRQKRRRQGQARTGRRRKATGRRRTRRKRSDSQKGRLAQLQILLVRKTGPVEQRKSQRLRTTEKRQWLMAPRQRTST
jgi:hypothetical protein